MKRYIITFLLLCTLKIAIYNQDAEFSQFFNNPVYSNPAQAGSTEFSRFTVNYRNRWPFSDGLQKAFVSYNASYDQPVEYLQGGIGVLFHQDQQAGGTFKNTQLHLIYAYHLTLSKEIRLQAALQFSLMQNSLDISSTIFPDMIDLNQGIINVSREAFSSKTNLFLDYSLGFNGIYKDINVGFCIHHLTQPSALGEEYQYNLNRKYSILYSQIFTLKKSISWQELYTLKPVVLFQQQGELQQFEWGCILRTNVLSTGLLFRQDISFNYDAAIIFLGLTYNSFIFAYSYDFNLPERGISTPLSGGHEIVIQLKMQFFDKRKQHKTIK